MHMQYLYVCMLNSMLLHIGEGLPFPAVAECLVSRRGW